MSDFLSFLEFVFCSRTLGLAVLGFMLLLFLASLVAFGVVIYRLVA